MKQKKVTVTKKVIADVDAMTKALDAHLAARAPGEKVDICATWAIVKPFWSTITTIVNFIPRVGGKISQALMTIGATLDASCQR